MKARSILYAVILTSGSTTVSAQEIVGSWSGTLNSPMGPFVMAFEFMVEEGSKLVGSMVNDMMGSIPISEGSIEGNELAFKTLIEGGPGGAMTMSFDGELDGDELTLTLSVEGMPAGAGGEEQTFVATRAE